MFEEKQWLIGAYNTYTICLLNYVNLVANTEQSTDLIT